MPHEAPIRWKLFIDDERYPPDASFILCRNVFDARQLIWRFGIPHHIAFDFFLRGHETALDIIEFLHAEICWSGEGYSLPEDFTYSVHSDSSEGGAQIHKAMKALFEESGFTQKECS